jgi:hypothetical protein
VTAERERFRPRIANLRFNRKHLCHVFRYILFTSRRLFQNIVSKPKSL